MKGSISYLHSKVGRRIFGLFILCALLPIIILGILSLYQVSGKLKEATHERLSFSNKNSGMAMIEGLNFFKAELEALVAHRDLKAVHPFRQSALQHAFALPAHFRTLSLIENHSKAIPIFGKPCLLPALNDDALERLVSGGVMVYTAPGTETPGRVFMAIALPNVKSAVHLLAGEIDSNYLWELVSRTLPPMTEVIIINSYGNQLFSSMGTPRSVIERIRDGLRKSASGQFEWNNAGESWLVNYRTVFLRAAFLTDEWTVVLSQSRSDALAALSKFTVTFTLVLVLTLLVVLYLSSVHIRRSLIPLAKLREGTGNISRGDLVSRVDINSGDEFEDLALSFNTMSKHLQKQFDSLTEMGRIIRAILSELERERIVAAVLDNLQCVITCEQVAVFLLEPDSDTISAYLSGTNDTVPLSMSFSTAERLQLDLFPENTLLQRNCEFDNLFSVMEGDGLTAFALLSIRLHNNLAGILAIGYRNRPEQPQEDLMRARQIADQVAVAMANADLIKELAQLNWGTISALAKAVDANSPWTAGHSERVTKFALQIGRHMGLSATELERLHRAALLHDIGKLGVPGYILDKADKLTDEEFSLMKEHPAKGAEILEPIPFYREVIPLVSQHHEYFNGRGYPLGLSGDDISLGARILSVADVYDALLTDRPYRPGWKVDRVIEYIGERAGEQFDPAVVQALMGSVVNDTNLSATV